MNYCREIFGLAIRLLGFWFLFRGLVQMPDQLQLFSGSVLRVFVLTNRGFESAAEGFGHLFVAAWPLAVAYALLRGAPALLRMTYPEAASKPDPARNDGAASGPKN